MAEGGKSQLAATNSSSSLTCGICLEQYKEPKILPCSHTFCLACLQKTLSMKEERAAKHAKAQLESLRTPIRQEPDGETVDQEQSYDDNTEIQRTVKTQTIGCPVCKREHTVPLGGMAQFPADFEAIQAIEMELLQKSLTKSKVSQKCGSCSKEKPITNHCDECGGICQRCRETHEELVVFAKHTVVPIKDVTADSLGPKKKTHLCSRHGEKVTMYCDRCCQVICHICIVKQHQGHSVSLLEEADQKLQEKIDQQSKDVQVTQRIFEKYREYIARVDGEMAGESYMKKLREKVSAEFDERIRRLQDKRDKLVQCIDNYDSQSKKQVWSEKNTIDLVLNKIQAGLRMTQKAHRLVNPADRIAMNSDGTRILAEVEKVTWSHESLPRPLVFKKKSSESLVPLQSSEDLSPSWEDLHVAPISEGDISVSVVDENGSKVRTPKLNMQTIVEVTFSVGMVEKPEFQVLYGKCRKILESVASYETTENKCWNIEFVPRCAGKHLVQIWLGGVAIAIKDDVTIDGKPRVGSKVCPGPDWVAPDDDTSNSLYLEGTVVNTSSSYIEVEWNQDPDVAEERTTAFPLIAEGEVEETAVDREEAEPLEMLQVERMEVDELPHKQGTMGGFSGQLLLAQPRLVALDDSDTEETAVAEGEIVVGDSTEITTPLLETKEPPTNTLIDFEEEPRPKFVRRRHKWGGFFNSETYEVELVL